VLAASPLLERTQAELHRQGATLTMPDQTQSGPRETVDERQDIVSLSRYRVGNPGVN